MKYSASFKLQVVKFASDNSNNSAASRKFGIDEKLVREWRRKIDNIKSLPKTKCADHGRKCQWPEKRNDQCFIVLKLALELSKYRYRGYLFVFKIYCSNFILEFQIICLFYLTDEN